MKSERVAIVNPYSSGSLLPEAFRKKGIECLAIHTQCLSDSVFSGSYNQSDFSASLSAADDSLDTLARKLQGENLLAVVPGIDSGVTLADQLCERLSMPATNNTQMQQARRNKDSMQAAIAQAGLRHIKSVTVDSYEQAEHWINENCRLPVVVKPKNSGGSNGVKKCTTLKDVEHAVESLLGEHNLFGLLNKKLVVQEYLQGDEFCVDGVSCRGIHYTTNIGKYYTEVLNGSFVFRMIDYTYPLQGEISDKLTDYCYAVLNALGIEYGAYHCEIMLTDDGPVLIETGARLHGGKNPPLLVENCSDHALVDLVVDSYVDFESFDRRVKTKAHYKKNGAGIFFINKKSGKVKGIPALDNIANLESLFALDKFVSEGDDVGPTMDLYTSPLWVYIANGNTSQFKQDLSYLLELNDSQLLLDFE